MRLKRKADRFQCMPLPHREWKRTTGKFAFLPKMHYSEELPPMKHDYKLVLDVWDGTLKIAIPIAFNQPQKTTKEKVISLDPGIRTPWVGYDPGGEIIEFSPHLRPEIQRLH